MSAQVSVAFLLFALSMSLTPGAGNITLLGISNRYGFFAALPFVAGTAFGVFIVFAGTSMGLLSVLMAYPELFVALKYIGAGYLLYISWGIINFQLADGGPTVPVSGFVSGALIQVLNPKAWIAAVTVFSQFIDLAQDYLVQVVLITVAFLLVLISCTLSWAYFGALLNKLLHSPRQMLMLNRCLGGTLVMTVIFMLSQPH